MKIPNRFIKLFVLSTHFFIINACSVDLDRILNREEWVELSVEECRSHTYLSYYIPELDELELIRCSLSSEYRYYLYFNLTDALAPSDWLIFLMNEERVENQSGLVDFTKTSDNSYCQYGKEIGANDHVCYTEYKYYEEEKYYHKYIYNPS